MAETRPCSSLKEHEQVVFVCHDYANNTDFPWDGSVVKVYPETKKVLVSYLLGYKGENEFIPFEKMLAVYDPKGEHIRFGSIHGPSRLLTAD